VLASFCSSTKKYLSEMLGIRYPCVADLLVCFALSVRENPYSIFLDGLFDNLVEVLG
jgi:hypothetical protein